jgi:hypothetical protein
MHQAGFLEMRAVGDLPLDRSPSATVAPAGELPGRRAFAEQPRLWVAPTLGRALENLCLCD